VTQLGDETRRALGAEGPLARAIPAFLPRIAQERMADAVAAAMDDRACLIAEAGTGTGKTYAYLVPALLSGLRVIVSTGTRALQDQLYHRDLPRVRDALGVRMRSALLKGRSNYLCWHRIERARGEGRFASRDLAAQLMQVQAWAGRSESGDVAEIDFVPEDSPLWPQVTSTAENCLGSECPFWSDCFVVKARQQAQEADLVVVNHHLLFADLALKREGFGEILPGAHAFVLDEAHQLPELASQFFSTTVSARQLQELARDAIAESGGASGALSELQEPARDLEQRLRELRLALETLPGRGTLGGLLGDTEAATAFDALALALDALHAALKPHEERSVGLKACVERAEDQRTRLRSVGGEGEVGEVRWYETTARGFSLHLTPLDVSSPLREFRQQSRAAWIYTSATLAVAGKFDHLSAQLGLDEPRTLLEPSPFDYATQALAYLPSGLPEPGQRGYVEAIVDAVLPVLDASNGRAFLLFTSHRALREAADLLALRRDFPLFVQGTQPRHRLLEDFRQSGNGVLLGAASFWEGVDVAGDALQLVVIDKLPFAAPDDPVLEARLDAIRRSGGNPFRDWQLPTAVIGLKQGAGRLIRTHTDRGVLVLCDPRLSTKSYGRTFLDSLPPLPRTRELRDAVDFLAAQSPP
jgi:ATP-dependent DNA helicase DinG